MIRTLKQENCNVDTKAANTV